MGKTTIHCVRHAQGYHNLSIANEQLPDPLLTTLGEQQCAALSQTFPHHARITHLVASPLRRTLYTTLLSFPDEVAAGLKITALPELQETSDLPCDTGSEPCVLAEEFSKGKFAGTVDFGLVQLGWNSKTGKWAPTPTALEARALDARNWLRELASSASKGDSDKDVDVVVVSHGTFLHYLTEDWKGVELHWGTGWFNAEYRSFDLVVENEEERVKLVEMEESKVRRGHVKDEESRLVDGATAAGLNSQQQQQIKVHA